MTVIRSLQRKLAPDNVGPEHVEPTFLQELSTKAGAAKAHRFQNLYGSLNESLLYQAWGNLNKQGAPGVDKVTVAQYGENLGTNIKRLVERLKQGEYRSRLIRRKYIPKGKGKLRPLGIPVVEDRLLQGAAKLLLEAIFEQDFHPVSYGYRPGIGAQQAVKDLNFELQCGRYGYVVEADIKGFFTNIDHDWLLEMIAERVDDKLFLGLIDSWLKAGILEEDSTVCNPHTGTPQGGLCKALHKPPYAKLTIMQSKPLRLPDLSTFSGFTLHNITTTSDLKANQAMQHPCSSREDYYLPDLDRRS